jgi:hypothetical protein
MILPPFLFISRAPFYKARTQIKIQTLRSLTNNLRINFLFFSVNLIWLDLSSNILSNDYMFIKKYSIREIDGQSLILKTVTCRAL